MQRPKGMMLDIRIDGGDFDSQLEGGDYSLVVGNPVRNDSGM